MVGRKCLGTLVDRLRARRRGDRRVKGVARGRTYRRHDEPGGQKVSYVYFT